MEQKKKPVGYIENIEGYRDQLTYEVMCRVGKDSSFREIISMLEQAGWKYLKEEYDARKPCRISDVFEIPLITEEINPDELEKMCGNKEKDLEIAIKNAEKRRQNIIKNKRRMEEGSFNHAILIIQELYEAGWKWEHSLDCS